MVMKCVHKGCGKEFTDENEPCVYHPGPPEFHEGQKGWKCCKPRVLTFDEFLSIPPCTTGKHSTFEDTPEPQASPQPAEAAPVPVPVANGAAQPASSTNQASAARAPVNRPVTGDSTPAPLAAPESDSDEPDAIIPTDKTCKRRGCNAKSPNGGQCVYHPGQALFHEGSKGWTCCKRRVLEFDEFLKIEGCKTRPRHCFVGKAKKKREDGGEEMEQVQNVRNDFYQTATTVHASFFLKKIDKTKSKIDFSSSGKEIVFDLITQDGKQYSAKAPLYGSIDPEKSNYKILGTKLELTLAKTDGLGWPVLRSDEKQTGEIIQTGRAGRA